MFEVYKKIDEKVDIFEGRFETFETAFKYCSFHNALCAAYNISSVRYYVKEVVI